MLNVKPVFSAAGLGAYERKVAFCDLWSWALKGEEDRGQSCHHMFLAVIPSWSYWRQTASGERTMATLAGLTHRPSHCRQSFLWHRIYHLRFAWQCGAVPVYLHRHGDGVMPWWCHSGSQVYFGNNARQPLIIMYMMDGWVHRCARANIKVPPVCCRWLMMASCRFSPRPAIVTALWPLFGHTVNLTD